MKIHLLENRKRGGYATFGCMWEKGKIPPKENYALKSECGKRLPVQSRVTAYWPDGSVKWTAHTADSSLMGERAEVVPDCGESVYTEKDALRKEGGQWFFEGKRISFSIPENGNAVIKNLAIDGTVKAGKASLVLILEEKSKECTGFVRREYQGTGQVEKAVLEESGPLSYEFRLSGSHVFEDGAKRIPFVLRIRSYIDSDRLDFTHTFIYDGDEERDFLKGIGIRFDCKLKGESFNRHIKFGTDYGCFHESASLLTSWRPRIPAKIYEMQNAGKAISDMEQAADPAEGQGAPAADGKISMEELRECAGNMPCWSRYQLYQDSDSHFCIRKKVAEEDCCYIEGLHGGRAQGTVAVGGEEGGLMFAVRDFWQKYPMGLEAEGLEQETAAVTLWLRTPVAESFDFRHYAVRSYDQTYYEGCPEFGATPYGIANTNMFSLKGFEGVTAPDEAVRGFGEQVNKPAIYVAAPEDYHALRAFGYWSLPSGKTEAEDWLERQLEKAVSFYLAETEQRKWYGMFNYGDFMHTYDTYRHCWKYDMGGFAWQNTELVPTLWLWLYFMRTGREDVFSLAEAMSRHCSEVDIYHIGKLKGIGSRHNVRHWGCPCKEARIAMAGHHRFYYYLSGDRRMEDIFEDVKDGDYALLEKDPLRYMFNHVKGAHGTHARSGPDWSSFVSNWMARWERFNDRQYEAKIRTGIEDIKALPLQLISGPDFEYEPSSGHLYYIGERKGGSHLQICMGSAQVWLELSGLLEDEEWKKILADYGRFYYMTGEEKQVFSKGIKEERGYGFPYMAAGIAAFGAMYYHDRRLAKKVWKVLLECLPEDAKKEGFQTRILKNAGNREQLREIPWIGTNFTAQWCLNVIMALEFIREELETVY